MLFKTAVESNTLELLKKLCDDSNFNQFNLAGGTSLALQLGHRKSIDLDMFTQFDFDVSNLIEYLEENYQFKLDFTAKNTIKGSINNIKVDFIAHKYSLVANILNTDSIRLFPIEDIAAMKLNAIAGNGTRSKDFIDIYFILNSFTINDIILFYKNKYAERNTLHVVKSLIYFNDISLNDWPEMMKEKGLTLEKVKKKIIEKVRIFNKNL